MKIASFFRTVYGDNRLRRTGRRSLGRDLALYALNVALLPVEKVMTARYAPSPHPIVFIVGAPRSGTTLLFQLLSYFLDVAYVNNRTARFWIAPVTAGALDARRSRHRLPQFDFDSSFGATTGGDAPHEFSWFWQYRMPPMPYDHLDEDELSRIDWNGIRKELEAFAGALSKPLVMKSINFVDYHIAWIARMLQEARFVWIRREPSFVVQSILESRRTRYGSEAVWWSVRPRDVAWWESKPPLEQVCHQVADIEREIGNALRALPGNRHMTVSYEDMVTDPDALVARVAEWIGARWRDRQEAPSNLGLRNGNRVRMDRFDEIARLLDRS